MVAAALSKPLDHRIEDAPAAGEKIDRKNELVIIEAHSEFENSGFIVSKKF